MKKWIKEHSLTLALLVVLIAQSIAFWYLRYPEWVTSRQVDKLPTDMGDYLRHYWAEYMVSILADSWGALLLVFLSKYLWERGSSQS